MNKVEFLAMELMLDEACEMIIRKAGVYRFPKKYKFDEHSHLEYEINYINRGTCRMIIDREIRMFHAGECIIIPPHVGHSFSVDNKEGCKITQIELKMEMENKIKSAFSFCCAEQKFYLLKNCEDLTTMIERIAQIHRREQEDDYAKTMEKMVIIEMILSLGHYLENETGRCEAKVEHRIKEITEYLKLHFGNEIDLEEVASLHGVSSRYMRKCFADNLGVSCIQYITMLRIQHAKHQLWETKKSILDIAIESGFGSAQYFCKIFKKNEGISPKQYRMIWKEKYHI